MNARCASSASYASYASSASLPFSSNSSNSSSAHIRLSRRKGGVGSVPPHHAGQVAHGLGQGMAATGPTLLSTCTNTTPLVLAPIRLTSVLYLSGRVPAAIEFGTVREDLPRAAKVEAGLNEEWIEREGGLKRGDRGAVLPPALLLVPRMLRVLARLLGAEHAEVEVEGGERWGERDASSHESLGLSEGTSGHQSNRLVVEHGRVQGWREGGGVEGEEEKEEKRKVMHCPCAAALDASCGSRRRRRGARCTMHDPSIFETYFQHVHKTVLAEPFEPFSWGSAGIVRTCCLEEVWHAWVPHLVR